jgi:hypothetical protein
MPPFREPMNPAYLTTLWTRVLEVEMVLPDMLSDILLVHAMDSPIAILAFELAEAANPATFESVSTADRRIAVVGTEV